MDRSPGRPLPFCPAGGGPSGFGEDRGKVPARRKPPVATLRLNQGRYRFHPHGTVTWTAGQLEVSEAKVREIISFYFMYRDEPQAKYVLQVCHNISCHIMGSRSLMTHMEKKLGVRRGETTPDGLFALEGAECLGACGMGPCMLVGKHLYEHLTNEKADEILESMRRGEPLPADTDRDLED
ncbi:NAD(P)H-dependent oxidoreductase subunit E [bacterium]|nr:NAD(P)H-dependent oxidoreductase subunit E [bacterium]